MKLKQAYYLNMYDYGRDVGLFGPDADGQPVLARMKARMEASEGERCTYFKKERDFYFRLGLMDGIREKEKADTERENSICKIDKLGGGPIEKSGFINGIQIDIL